MMMLRKMKIFVLLIGLPEEVHANKFLGPYPLQALSKEASSEFEDALLGELEKVLGSEHRTFTEKRLSKIEEVVRPMVRALPQNEYGKLGHGAVSYVLHRLFVQRHGWFIRGLEPEGDATWNTTSPVKLFTDRVPEFVQGVMEKRMGDTGLDVHEIAILAATFEHLVHKEGVERLRLAYKVHTFSPEDVMVVSEATSILETYMSIYILSFVLSAKADLEPSVQEVKELVDKVEDIYPTWPATQAFIHEVQESVAPNRDYLYFSDVTTVIEEAEERYGRWQDHECRELKETLLAIEDTGPGGAGRVRLADFYGLALNEGKWQFGESVSYLRNLGVLDESDPNTTRVIISNYIYSPSNCVASSSYYSVCCINECESLFAHLEQKLAKPDVPSGEIIKVVSSLLSVTQQQSRELSPWLVKRLEDVAAHHGGLVPLHGRLFSQWMHFAYPRECPYPHVSGTIHPMHLSDIVATEEDVREATATEEDMKEHVESMPARLEQILNSTAHEELTMLSMEEELVVWRPPQEARAGHLSVYLRLCAFVGSILALSASLVKKADAHFNSQPGQDKYYV